MSLSLLLPEDFGRVLDVEPRQVLGGEQRPFVRVRGREHRRQETAGARAGDDVEVVRDTSVWPVQFLHVHAQAGRLGTKCEDDDANTMIWSMHEAIYR